MNGRAQRPRGLLLDYGGTLVEEVAFDARAGMDVLLANVVHCPAHVTLDEIRERVERVTREVSAHRDQFHIETPWPALTRLIYDYFGVKFARPLDELELAFWNAAVTTHPMPGARAALREIQRLGVPMGVVSNSSFRSAVIRHELAKHGLADHISVVVASAEYAARKPNPLLFETAAALLGVPARDIWFVGDRLDTDVAGARASGMCAVWLTAEPNVTDAADGAIIVRSWAELLATVTAH